MKLTKHFSDFLKDTINLNETRLGQLDSSAEAIKTFLRNSDWKPTIKGFHEHGSWAHRTIIKPKPGKPFDADLLVRVAPVEGWDAKKYLSELRKVFADSSTYNDKVRRYSHCVTIEYAGERKIDIAPCVVNRDSVTREEVCNFDSNAFERTEPQDYTKWINDRDRWAGLSGLRKTTRLLKYLRDIKTTFSCSSFLMTTLLGDRIDILDLSNAVDFSDTPTSLKTIVGRLDDWLQAREYVPTVVNPALQSEVISGEWSQSQYANFRDKMHTYREWIDDAYDEVDRDESIGKWRRVFGDDFAAGVSTDKAANVSKAAQDFLRTTSLTPRNFDGDLIDLLRQFGKIAIPPAFSALPHKQRPTWKRSAAPLFSVNVVARLHDARNGTWLSDITDASDPLPKNRWIQFQLRNSTGMPLSGDYDIYWRITNTDQAAFAANCLRGGFEKSNDGSSHWERLEYRGVHSAEAFVIRKRDKMLVAESAIFYVPIE